MNDEQLQREIEEALSAEPSPQFIARVRRQIANESKPSRRFHGMLAAGMTATIFVGILVLQPWTSRNVVPQESVKAMVPKPEVPHAEVPEPEVAAPAAEPGSKAQPAPKIASRPPQPKSVEPDAVPEVLIDPREVAAFRSFVDAVEKQNIDPNRLEKVFDAAERANKADITPMPLAGLEPIRIEPLSPAAPERGSL
jgi:hypothetical protein